MGFHELNTLIAHFSRDPDNAEAMERAIFYRRLRDLMFGSPETTDESEDAA